jgi:hypothetical protein
VPEHHPAVAMMTMVAVGIVQEDHQPVPVLVVAPTVPVRRLVTVTQVVRAVMTPVVVLLALVMMSMTITLDARRQAAQVPEPVAIQQMTIRLPVHEIRLVVRVLALGATRVTTTRLWVAIKQPTRQRQESQVGMTISVTVPTMTVLMRPRSRTR